MDFGKFITLGILALASSVSMGSSTPCGRNEQGKAIQLVCVSATRDNKVLISLRLRSGEKIYLKQIRSRKSGYGEQEFGQIVNTLTVMQADQYGQLTGRSTSTVKLSTSLMSC